MSQSFRGIVFLVVSILSCFCGCAGVGLLFFEPPRTVMGLLIILGAGCVLVLLPFVISGWALVRSLRAFSSKKLEG